MAWLIPKGKLISKISFKEGIVKVTSQKGEEFQAPLAELKVRFEKDKYDRRIAILSHQNKKMKIFELGYLLTDEEWERVFEILGSIEDSGDSAAQKAANVLSIVKNILEFFTE